MISSITITEAIRFASINAVKDETIIKNYNC